MFAEPTFSESPTRLGRAFIFSWLFAVLLVGWAANVLAQITPSAESLSDLYPGKVYSPYAQRSFPDRVFWGGTHLHTGLSMDAGLFGCSLGLDEAYRFARGEQVMASSGQPVRLGRPLDWLVIADHSDGMGFFNDLAAGKPSILKFDQAKPWYEGLMAGGEASAAAALSLIGTFSQGEIDPEMMAEYSPGGRTYASIWEEVVNAAERFNDPGHFTAFIGFEWTSLDAGNNLHRSVIFREGAEKAGQVVPYTTQAPVGSTDSHTALSAVEEENFFGKATNAEPSPKRMAHPFAKSEHGAFEGYELVASGYTSPIWFTP